MCPVCPSWLCAVLTSRRRRHLASRRAGWPLAAVSLLLAGQAGVAVAEELRIGGTGAGLGVLQRLSDAWARQQPGTTIVLLPSLGSSGGIKAARAGALSLAISGRAPEPAELAAGAVAVELGRTPFVIAVGPQVKAQGLKLSQLAALLSGQALNWPDGQPARPVLRPLGDSDTDALRAMGAAMPAAIAAAAQRPGLPVAMTDQDCADRIAELPGGFGPSTLALMLSESRPLRALAIDGQPADLNALAQGRYAYARTLWLVTGAKAGAPAQQLLAFARSAAGRAVLRDAGVLAP